MRFQDKTSLAWSNLGRRKVRTILTSVGVVVGITTLVTMISLVNGVQSQVKQQFEKIGLDRVVVRPEGESAFGGGFNLFDLGGRVNTISPADVQRWKAWPEAVQVIPEIEIPSSVVSGVRWRGKTVPVRIGSNSTPRRGPFSEPPTALFGSLDLPGTRGHIVLGRGTLRSLKIPERHFASLIGQNIDVVLAAPRGQQQSFRFKIFGISSQGDRGVEVSMPDRLAMKGWWFNNPKLLQEEGYDSVTLRAADVTGAKALVVRLRKENLSVQSIDAILDVANRIFAAITAMLGLMSSVALFVAFIGIANTMIMSIYERTREIGTLKAMGASRSDIRQMFMLEAGLIGLFGGFAGLGLSWILGQGLDRFAHWMAQQQNIPLPDELFLITPALAMQSLVFAFLIGIVAGLYPAHRAARLDPLAALRHE
jgi:ABC-type lipoprotein release transport system permease subunit